MELSLLVYCLRHVHIIRNASNLYPPPAKQGRGVIKTSILEKRIFLHPLKIWI